MSKISIIIRTYNEENFIGNLLTSISKQRFKDYEIIIVDSGSTDNTLKIVRNFKNIKVIEISSREFSFGRSLNIGIRKAFGEYIVFISAHCYPVNNLWLEKIVEPFKNKNVAMVYGKQRGNIDSKFSEIMIFNVWFPDKSDENQRSPFSNNANAAIRKNIWKKIPYDENLTGLEDIDWAKKAQSKGYKIVYSKDAEIVHIHCESWSRIFNRYKREAIAMKDIFPEIKFSFIDFIKLSMLNIFNDLKIANQNKLFLRKFKEVIYFRLSQFYGTYRGYKYGNGITEDLRKRFYYPENNIDKIEKYKINVNKEVMKI